MIRFALILLMSLAVSSQVLAAKWNNPKSENTDQDASKENSNTFEDVVKEAMDKGFTEPDPKIDLSGIDVARKILIICFML